MSTFVAVPPASSRPPRRFRPVRSHRGAVAVGAAGALAAVVAVTLTGGVSGFAGGQASAAAGSASAAACTVACTETAADVALRTGAVDATSTLQAALSRALPGSVVAVGAGTYMVSDPLTIPAGVTFVGAGMDATRLVYSTAAAAAAPHTFMIAPAAGVGEGRTGVRGLTLDGAHQASTSEAQTPTGVGGVSAGSGWVIDDVRLSNLGYFKVWLNSVSDVTVRGSRFEDSGTGASSGHDNIGGGGVSNVTISANTVTASAKGNAVDLVRSSGVTLAGNEVEGTATAPHNIYLEGVTNSLVTDNVLTGSAISVQSNAEYKDHPAVINPAGVVITGNTISDTAAQGISVRYDSPRAGEASAAAGGNTISNNTTSRTGVAGIAIIAEAAGLAVTPDDVSQNTVTDAFTRGTSTWNTGYGITSAAGIVMGAGAGSQMVGNTVHNTGVGAANYGVQVGLDSARWVIADVQGADSTTVDAGVTTVR